MLELVLDVKGVFMAGTASPVDRRFNSCRGLALFDLELRAGLIVQGSLVLVLGCIVESSWANCTVVLRHSH